MEALMDLADWLRSLGLERYEAAHIEPGLAHAKTEIRLTRPDSVKDRVIRRQGKLASQHHRRDAHRACRG
jgi:hypothetical protein